MRSLTIWLALLMSALLVSCTTDAGMRHRSDEQMVVPQHDDDPTTAGSNAPVTQQSTSLSKCLGDDCNKCSADEAFNSASQSCERKPCGGACHKGQFCDKSSDRCMNDVVPASSTPGQ